MIYFQMFRYMRPHIHIIFDHQNQGQLVIAADYKRYVLGRGLAQKIMVQQQRRVENTTH